MFLYNIGVNTFVVFYIATFNRKRVDLNASLMSTQGKGSGQYLTIVPTFLLPIVIYFLFLLFGRFGLFFCNLILPLVCFGHFGVCQVCRVYVGFWRQIIACAPTGLGRFFQHALFNQLIKIP